MVAPHAAGPYAVGVDVDIAHVTVAAITLGGTIAAREVIATEGVVQPDGLVRLVLGALQRLRTSPASPGRVCGVGISIPGTVDVATGRIGVAPNLGWENTRSGGCCRT